MNELLNELHPLLISLMTTVLTAIASFIGIKIKAIYEAKVNSQIKRDVVEDVCRFVEQVYTDLHGEEKLNKAIESATEMLSDKGISITELELRVLIESTVHGFAEPFKVVSFEDLSALEGTEVEHGESN